MQGTPWWVQGTPCPCYNRGTMARIDERFHPMLGHFFTAQEVERCRLHFRGLLVNLISLPGLRRRAAAITFGRRVFLRPDHFESLNFPRQVGLLAHELTHVRQYRRFGLVPYFALYLLVYPLFFWRVSQHPLEQPAYQRGREMEALAQESSPSPS